MNSTKYLIGHKTLLQINKRNDKIVYVNNKKSPANSTLPHFLGQLKTAHVGVADSKAYENNILSPDDLVNKFDKGEKFSQNKTTGNQTVTQVRNKLVARFGKRIVELLESKDILKIHQTLSDKAGDSKNHLPRQLHLWWHSPPLKRPKRSESWLMTVESSKRAAYYSRSWLGAYVRNVRPQP